MIASKTSQGSSFILLPSDFLGLGCHRAPMRQGLMALIGFFG
jgi:hypothetical protein